MLDSDGEANLLENSQRRLCPCPSGASFSHTPPTFSLQNHPPQKGHNHHSTGKKHQKRGRLKFLPHPSVLLYRRPSRYLEIHLIHLIHLSQDPLSSCILPNHLIHLRAPHAMLLTCQVKSTAGASQRGVSNTVTLADRRWEVIRISLDHAKLDDI